MGLGDMLTELSRSVIDGRHPDAERATRELLAGGAKAADVLEQGLLPGMEVVGERFKRNQIFLPQVLVSARAMKASLKLLDPVLSASDQKRKGTILIGTVKGDLHDIGKNLVGIMLQGAGYTVIDLGTDCSPSLFLEALRQHHPDVIALSALLTTTMLSMKSTVESLRNAGVTLPIIVGGAPVSQKFADSIGATAYARTAPDAVDVVRRLLGSAAP